MPKPGKDYVAVEFYRGSELHTLLVRGCDKLAAVRFVMGNVPGAKIKNYELAPAGSWLLAELQRIKTTEVEL